MIKPILRWTSVLTFLLCAFSVLAATETVPTRIAWDQACPITWNHFQQTPPADAGHRAEAAAIHMTIRWHASYSVSSSNGTNWIGQVASVTVSNMMEPTLSWVVQEKAHASVLHHEQLHFDLNEVYRHKLDCLLLRTATCSGTTQQEVVNLLDEALHRTADAVLKKLAEMQALYDSQTAHGSNSGEQAHWESSINEWLISPTTAP